MANWNNPALDSSYSNFLDHLKSRDLDAANMFMNTPTNPKTGFMRYNRGSNKFQEYRSNAWRDEIISIASGGTGVSTLTALIALVGGGGGDIDLSNVSITGGTISGIGSLGVNGNATIGGQLITGSGSVNLTNAGGKIPSFSSDYFASLNGSNLTNLRADRITSGTLDTDRIPSLSANKITSDTFDTDRIPSLDASKINAGTFNTGRIPSLSADKITSDAFDTDRIPNISANKVTSDSFNSDRIPSLNASKINDGVFNAARLGTGTGNTKFLRRDGSWADLPFYLDAIQSVYIKPANTYRRCTVNC